MGRQLAGKKWRLITIEMSSQENKTCPYCAETIPAAAKRCPRCRIWLSFRSLRHPLVGVFVVVLPVMAAYFMMGYKLLNHFQMMMNPPPFYSDFPGSIKVLESRMNWADTTDGRFLFVTGIVTNQSSASWRGLEFDIRFFDSNGQMIDAANGRSLFTILPGNESAFRVSVKPLLSSNDYSSFRISVSNARSAKGPF
jgi:hypothetical protein